MQIVKSSFKTLGLTPEIGRQKLQNIEYAARISHRSEELQNENTLERFISFVVVTHGDWSVTEHESVSVEFVMDKALAQELVRHRIAAYTIESTRFVNYNKQMEASYIYPIVDDRFPENSLAYNLWLKNVESADYAYKELLAEGFKPEDARAILPNCVACKVMATMNLRSWRHFFLMRTSKESHPQIRQLAIELLEEFKRCIPILYDDIEPNSRQITNLSRGR